MCKPRTFLLKKMAGEICDSLKKYHFLMMCHIFLFRIVRETRISKIEFNIII